MIATRNDGLNYVQVTPGITAKILGVNHRLTQKVGHLIRQNPKFLVSWKFSLVNPGIRARIRNFVIFSLQLNVKSTNDAIRTFCYFLS